MTRTANELQSQACAQLEELFERLAQVDGKAEILDGEIVQMSPTGAWPALVALQIAASLQDYTKQGGRGLAVGDNATFRVTLPHRGSFSPDAACFIGPEPGMGPFLGAPVFAVEIRSIGDYGPKAEQQLAKKRDDYFACGTQVVWDVNLLSGDLIRAYWATSPDQPVVYRHDEIADAEPAVPGWTVSVAELLPNNWELPADSAS